MELIFNQFVLKRLIILFILFILAFILTQISNQTEWLWFLLPISALPFIPLKVSLKNNITSTIITGIIGAVLLLLTPFLNHFFILKIIYLIFMSVFIFYFTSFTKTSFYSRCILILILLLSGLTNLTTIYPAIYFFSASILFMIFELTLLPNYYIHQRKLYTSLAYEKLKQLSNEIFIGLLNAEYKKHLYLFERRLHRQKSNFLNTLSRLIKIEKIIRKEDLNTTIKKLEQIYCLLLDLSQIRRRIDDHDTFQVCDRELKGIGKSLNQLFDEFKKNKVDTNELVELKQGIQSLEDNYHHILQVSAKDPFAFLLFIQSLNYLHEELLDLSAIV